jgi:hypothetical protein
MRLVLICFIAVLLSCSTIPPEKPFKSQLWYIDTETMTIQRYNEDGDLIVKEINNLDENWIVIHVDDVYKEWDYQEFLKKECLEWR